MTVVIYRYDLCSSWRFFLYFFSWKCFGGGALIRVGRRLWKWQYAEYTVSNTFLWKILAQATRGRKKSFWNFGIIKENAVQQSLVTKLQDLWPKLLKNSEKWNLQSKVFLIGQIVYSNIYLNVYLLQAFLIKSCNLLSNFTLSSSLHWDASWITAFSKYWMTAKWIQMKSSMFWLIKMMNAEN